MTAIHDRILAGSPAKNRLVEGERQRAHLIESGDGPPVVLFNGSGPSALLMLPLLERLDGVWGIGVDRPGFGLSDPAEVPRGGLREGAVEFVDHLLDALGLDEAAVGGSSMGGAVALWYALARPERVRRLILLGAGPLLPGTRVPPPLRIMVTPVGTVLSRLMKPSPKLIVQQMASFGEKETIADYPELIEALVVAGHDQLASETGTAELRAIISPLGFRAGMRIQPDELRQVSVPTLLIWGRNDPLGGARVAEATAATIPHARLELFPAGHGPWLGHPNHIADLVSDFVK